MKEKEKAMFKEIESAIYDASLYAKEKQKNLSYEYKEDGTIVTDVDLEINGRIIKKIKELFPSSSICSEEENNVKGGGEYIFILDPIDGSDAYFQGLPSYAVALCVLDGNRMPIASYIAAPRFGLGTDSLFISMLPGETPKINGKEIAIKRKNPIPRQITLSSKFFRRYDLKDYPGKVRIFGSTIIHALSPILFPYIDAALIQPCYIWDIAAADAVIRKTELESVYFSSGRPFVYSDDLLARRRTKETIIVGNETDRLFLLSCVKKRE